MNANTNTGTVATQALEQGTLAAMARAVKQLGLEADTGCGRSMRIALEVAREATPPAPAAKQADAMPKANGTPKAESPAPSTDKGQQYRTRVEQQKALQGQRKALAEQLRALNRELGVTTPANVEHWGTPQLQGAIAQAKGKLRARTNANSPTPDTTSQASNPQQPSKIPSPAPEPVPSVDNPVRCGDGNRACYHQSADCKAFSLASPMAAVTYAFGVVRTREQLKALVELCLDLERAAGQRLTEEELAAKQATPKPAPAPKSETPKSAPTEKPADATPKSKPEAVKQAPADSTELPTGPLTQKQAVQLGKVRLEALADKLGVKCDASGRGGMAKLASAVSKATQPAPAPKAKARAKTVAGDTPKTPPADSLTVPGLQTADGKPATLADVMAALAKHYGKSPAEVGLALNLLAGK
jgi:hypothetical protein